jgi:hypothetical protein
LVTLIEAAGLSGRPVDELRGLIEQGHLPARAVPLDRGTVYLVESAALDRVSPRGRALAEALAGLRAALLRRHLAAEAEHEADDEPPRPAPSRPRRALSTGLDGAALTSLARRVDRLLGP